MGRAFHHGLCAEHGGRAANGTAGRGHQRGFAVDFKQFAEQYAEENGACHDDGIYGNGGQSYFCHLLKRQFEAVKHYARAQHSFRAELDARHPRLGQFVAQRVGVEHTEDNADNQRTERQVFYELELGDVESREGEEDY